MFMGFPVSLSDWFKKAPSPFPGILGPFIILVNSFSVYRPRCDIFWYFILGFSSQMALTLKDHLQFIQLQNGYLIHRVMGVKAFGRDAGHIAPFSTIACETDVPYLCQLDEPLAQWNFDF